MSKSIICILICSILLCGCGTVKEPESFAKLRSALVSGRGCEFDVLITTDYGRSVDSFGLHCCAVRDGAFRFEVYRPDNIQGVSGTVDQSGGTLSYDDLVLSFPLLAEETLSPVCAPWFICRCICDGLIDRISDAENRTEIILDYSFRGEVFRIVLSLGADGMPTMSEIYWSQRRIVSMVFSDFHIL